jgi:hypothetical protein
MSVAGGQRGTGLAEDDDPGGASIDAQCATRAHVVVDDEDHIVVRVISRQFGVICFCNSVRSDHVDALPWANVYATLAHDAFTLINVNELLWLYSLAQIIGINFNQLVFS